MAHDETVANRLRQALSKRGDFDEKRMFGGVAFMVRGHMCCGVVGGEIMLRVGPAEHARALAQPHAREMDFTGRPLTGMIYVAPAGFRTEKTLDTWVRRALDFVVTLPSRAPGRARKKAGPRRLRSGG